MDSSVSMGSKYGRFKRAFYQEDMDRISNLPDDLLVHILSRLPAKWAFQTSLLSKRWKQLWTSITCLDFKNHTSSLGSYNAEEFKKMVGHVFRSCNPKHVKKLILHYPWLRADESSVITWIDEWIKHEICELDLSVYNFPLSVFRCTTLTALTIGDCYDYDPEVVSFDLPSLKVLHINGRFSRFMETIISNCLVLEDLSLGGSNVWYTTNTFMIYTQTLKTLRLQHDETYVPNFSRVIIVETPKLECLHLTESFFDYKTCGSFSSLVKAYVNIGNIAMREHFEAFDLFTMPNFASLTYLEVISSDNRFWAMLLKFIESTPRLKVLSLEQKDSAITVEYDWAEPKYVPKCVDRHLRVIKLEGFKGRKHELQIVEYFLGSGKVLQTLAFSCGGGLGREEEMELHELLVKFTRASYQCEVEFHGKFIENYSLSFLKVYSDGYDY